MTGGCPPTPAIIYGDKINRIKNTIDVHNYVQYNVIKEVVNMKTVPVTSARQNIFNIIEQTIVNSEPIQITSKKGNVVMLSLDDWSAIQETLYLLEIPGMRESIIEGSKEPIGECKSLEDIGWHI